MKLSELLIIAASVAIVSALMMIRLDSLPTVYISHSNGHCVKAEFMGKKISCSDAMRGQYETIWAQ